MKSPKQRGFTLIELLVVIAIIAILAAILFPVLTSSKESARRTQCINQMKQIGTATLRYADDWGGYLPPFGLAGCTSMINLRDALKPQIKNDKIWKCPSDNGYKPWNVKPSFYVVYGTSYPYNQAIATTAAPPGKVKMFSTCKSPQQLVLYWDWVAHPIEGLWIQNTAFADGHIRALGYKELKERVENKTATLW